MNLFKCSVCGNEECIDEDETAECLRCGGEMIKEEDIWMD